MGGLEERRRLGSPAAPRATGPPGTEWSANRERARTTVARAPSATAGRRGGAGLSARRELTEDRIGRAERGTYQEGDGDCRGPGGKRWVEHQVQGCSGRGCCDRPRGPGRSRVQAWRRRRGSCAGARGRATLSRRPSCSGIGVPAAAETQASASPPRPQQERAPVDGPWRGVRPGFRRHRRAAFRVAKHRRAGAGAHLEAELQVAGPQQQPSRATNLAVRRRAAAAGVVRRRLGPGERLRRAQPRLGPPFSRSCRAPRISENRGAPRAFFTFRTVSHHGHVFPDHIDNDR